ncbi:autophagy cysteine endopeptidase Atg4, putative [Trichophyton verrucosum HKI 0517]|uniref:Cysteine protease n=1 Tax=Trichophyton verrucosum (strain HKI 0517) TaxID=663202 RepID=D4DEF7_TRIVH|nr:autophagy cysteine endopeptidase Atg4, putative [Trichophyton verrucosum HKI 0517]EFE39788.1 autophagy cysteine endopeptidase Atg4, putative [Trichophyton verrucosum HKI 0517]
MTARPLSSLYLYQPSPPTASISPERIPYTDTVSLSDLKMLPTGYNILTQRRLKMNNVDLGNQYKKIIQFFWDPEPKNDDSGQPIWCLGCEYRQAETPGPAQSSGEPADTTNRDREPTTLTSTPKTTASTTTTTTTTTDTTEKEKRTSTDGPPTPGSAISSFVNLASPISSSSTAESSVTPAWPPQFLDDFESKLWITYRSQFPPIPKTPKTGSGDSSSSISLGVRLRSQLIDTQGFTSDTGWGCMIRSGQALLANTLLFLRLGRDWRRGSKVQEESELVSLFADHPRAPFSIHRFVHHGATACGKCPGEWFGPSAASQCIQALVKSNPQVGLRVCITSDGSDIYEKQFKEVACDESGGGIQPTLILLGVRLGIDRVTPVYWDSLKALLRFPQSVGIAG